MEIALMIEGQNGLTWEKWQRLARRTEELGFVGLFRSDHFTNAEPPDKDSLELWLSLAWLADNSRELEFGPLVAPISFRHPVFIARWGKDLDALSAGRLVLGVGAGWQRREHEMFGLPLLQVEARFDRFEEGVEVVHRLLRSEGPVDFDGDYFQLRQAQLLPPPMAPGRPPILVGGNGPLRTLPLVAAYADQWNAVLIRPEEFRRLNERLDDLLRDNGRPPDSVRRSLMTTIVFGESEAEVEALAEKRGFSVEELQAGPAVVGTGQQVRRQLEVYRKAGVERIMLQWLELEDLDRLARLAESIMPVFHA